MSPLYVKIMDMLTGDDDSSFLSDASSSTVSGCSTDEAIRVRVGGSDYLVTIRKD